MTAFADTRTVPTTPGEQHPHDRAARPLSTVLDRVQDVAARSTGPVVRVALAIVLLWFGIPKLVPGGSPAEQLVVDTVGVLSGGTVTGDTARIAVALGEIALGVALLAGRWMPLVLVALVGHMVGTFTPLVLFPELTWRSAGVGTLEGQYILKNVVILACIVVLAGQGAQRRAGHGRRRSSN